MILTKEVTINVNPSNMKHLRELGYENLKSKEIITIPVEHLPKTSGFEIEAKCDVCGKKRIITYYLYLSSFSNGGYFSCSRKCSVNKDKQTCLEKYGSENYNNKEKHKQTCLEKYGSEGYNNHNKYKETCIKKYGVENGFQNNGIKEKIKEKIKKLYGVENPSQSELIKKKKIETCRKNFNTDHPLKNKTILNKIQNTNLEKYGTKSPTQNYKVKEKTKQTNLKKYGKESVLQVQDVKDKIKKTNLKRHGVEYPSQNTAIHDKMLKNSSKIRFYKKTELYYQGSYELDFLDMYYNKINIENGMTIRYRTNKIYYPDFYLPDFNLIIEIKSNYWYNKNLENNLEKQKYCLEHGYNFIFIMDKNYEKFTQLVDNQKSPSL